MKQKNKVRKVIGKVALIHGIDSFDLAKVISKVSMEKNTISKILLQINTSREPQKKGFLLEEAEEAYSDIAKLENIEVKGLMTMAPLTDDQSCIRASFAKLRALRDTLGLEELSMGMSGDWKIAIEEGATLVRIGSAIIGKH